MRKILSTLFIITFSLFFTTFTHAQDKELGFCGTKMPDKMLNWLKKYQENPVQYKTSSAVQYLPIQFHIVGDDDGIGHFPANDAFRLLCELNDDFSDVDIQFYINSEFHYINSTRYYRHNFGNGAQMMRNNNYDDVINVYIVDDPAGNCGYFTGGPDAVAVAKSCSGPSSTTLAHELGHYMSMPHTFLGWESGTPSTNQQELVNGSNCRSAGDFFCDTPADYIADRWSCPYSGGLTDPMGVPIDPDETLYMSYASDRCTSRFSPEQMQAMRAFLNSSRTDLLQNTVPPIDKVGDSYVFYPLPGAKNIPASQVLLSWHTAPGATEYYLELLQFTDLENGTDVKSYITDTFYRAILDPNVDYYWTVKPLSAGYSCSPSIGGSFKTTGENALYLKDLKIDPLSCYEAENGAIEIEVAGGTAPYTYEWSNGETGTQLSNIGVGQYKVTVTDANGMSNVLPVKMSQPNELSFDIVQLESFKAKIDVSGGTPPYLIEWSNGEIGEETLDLPVGDNSVIITDANGCSVSTAFKSMGIQIDVRQISCYEMTDGDIELTIGGGVPPYTYIWSYNAENSTNKASNLGKGVYSITVTDSEDNLIDLSVDIIEPTPLSATIKAGIGSAEATVEGGTPPYSFFWPNGFTTENSTSGLPQSNGYEVVIYDANNCEYKANFNVTIGTDLEETLLTEKLAVYPTLLNRNESLHILFTLKKQANIEWGIFNSNGQEVYREQQLYTTGSHEKQLNNSQLSAGLYLLKMNINGDVVTKKFVIR